MKHFLFILLFLPFFSIGQNMPFDTAKGKIIYSEIITINNATKNELYGKGLEWFAKQFNNSNEVLQVKEQEKGKLTGNGMFYINIPQIDKVNCLYTITLSLKDNNYKYEIYDIYYQGIVSGIQLPDVPVEDWYKAHKSAVNSKGEKYPKEKKELQADYIKQTNDAIQNQIANLKSAMNK